LCLHRPLSRVANIGGIEEMPLERKCSIAGRAMPVTLLTTRGKSLYFPEIDRRDVDHGNSMEFLGHFEISHPRDDSITDGLAHFRVVVVRAMRFEQQMPWSILAGILELMTPLTIPLPHWVDVSMQSMTVGCAIPGLRLEILIFTGQILA